MAKFLIILMIPEPCNTQKYLYARWSTFSDWLHTVSFTMQLHDQNSTLSLSIFLVIIKTCRPIHIAPIPEDTECCSLDYEQIKNLFLDVFKTFWLFFRSKALFCCTFSILMISYKETTNIAISYDAFLL